MTRTVDAVVVGSGHNGLVAAAYLARAGWSVEVLEQADRLGGAVATEELTVPGYRHDTFSSWHPLFRGSGAWAELGDELRARGLDYAESEDEVTASVLPDGGSVVAHRDLARTGEAFGSRDAAVYAAELEALGPHLEAIGGLLSTELHGASALRIAAGLGRGMGRRGFQALGSQVAASGRSWLDTRFADRAVGDLLAPWGLHTGLAPDDAGGGFPLLALAGGIHGAGMPVVRGGSARFVDAFRRLIEDHGGTLRTGAAVTSVVVRGGRAVGVRTADEEIRARRAVIANVTPTQLYGALLAPGDAPSQAVEEASRFRYGRRAGMQIHIALDGPLRWRGDERLGRTPVVHLTSGVDGVARACHEAASGLLPAEPTIVCGQPTVLDPSRAPDGKAILWIQLQEVPYRPTGDAAGQIDVGDGTWTPELVDAYVDRIVDRIGAHVDGLDAAIVGRYALSPQEIERRNPNLVRGDIYAGATDLDQSYLWRPLPSYGSHATPVRGLHHCGASTHPGPGLNAASGRIVAHGLLSPSPRERLRRGLRLGRA
jgi:phytoene dehydrogenase-like protein